MASQHFPGDQLSALDQILERALTLSENLDTSQKADVMSEKLAEEKTRGDALDKRVKLLEKMLSQKQSSEIWRLRDALEQVESLKRQIVEMSEEIDRLKREKLEYMDEIRVFENVFESMQTDLDNLRRKIMEMNVGEDDLPINHWDTE